jgi:uncharacterized membrane protein
MSEIEVSPLTKIFSCTLYQRCFDKTLSHSILMQIFSNYIESTSHHIPCCTLKDQEQVEISQSIHFFMRLSNQLSFWNHIVFLILIIALIISTIYQSDCIISINALPNILRLLQSIVMLNSGNLNHLISHLFISSGLL